MDKEWSPAGGQDNGTGLVVDPCEDSSKSSSIATACCQGSCTGNDDTAPAAKASTEVGLDRKATREMRDSENHEG